MNEVGERNEGVIGSKWHLRGESGQQTSFYTGQSVYGNYTSVRGGRKETKEGGRWQSALSVSLKTFLCIYCHLSSVIPLRLTEIMIEGEGH